ncbi:MAG: ABC transporter ATP-binding protein [Helicobacter sp.]|nr:ABC transporter ATP-binding protein [Helicobacter sp.]
MILLQASGLGHRFDCSLFHALALEVCEGETLSIVGVSGSGKSTLLHILATLLRPMEGDVFLFGKNIYTLSNDSLLAIRRNQIGIVFQSHYLFRGFSATENLQVATLLAGETIDENILQGFKIEHLLHSNASKLSGGEQQRLSIARVLMKKPKIIFADEPTGNLDQETSANVMNAIFDYVEYMKAALVLVTHDIELAHRCTKCFTLANQTLTQS